MDRELRLEEILAAERPRLVRLCARLSGSGEAAEDLAQEVLLAAWRHAHRLREPEQYAPWLSSIARNVCLHWSHRSRRHYREQSRLARQEPTESTADINDNLPDDFDLEVELERHELADLLDRALALLPAETSRALVEHYIEESPHAEIADRLGISAGAVAVRLHRGKLALRRVLTSTLREEAAAYGVVGNTDLWQETRVWCPSCGRRRLMMRVAQRSGTISFRCPACHPDPEAIDSEYRTANRGFAQLIGGLTRPRSILNRAAAWVHDYYTRALETGVLALALLPRTAAEPSPRANSGRSFAPVEMADQETSTAL